MKSVTLFAAFTIYAAGAFSQSESSKPFVLGKGFIL